MVVGHNFVYVNIDSMKTLSSFDIWLLDLYSIVVLNVNSLRTGNGLRKDIWAEFQTRFNIPRIAEFYGATEGNAPFANLSNKLGACGRLGPLLVSMWFTAMSRYFSYYVCLESTKA